MSNRTDINPGDRVTYEGGRIGTVTDVFVSQMGVRAHVTPDIPEPHPAGLPTVVNIAVDQLTLHTRGGL